MMGDGSHEIVSAEIGAYLTRLWRYGLVLSGDRDAAEDLVQATCVRALERAHQFREGTRLDRWLFSILNSIWKNELRSQKIRTGAGFVSAEEALIADGAAEVETNIFARQVLAEVQALPEVQRETVFLVYAEGLTYKEAAETLDVPVGTIMSRLAAARAKLGELNQEGAPGKRRTGQDR
ncbi:MAG: RNA polymerase sigma factor [Hyphomicrobiaceae bacterium]|nr:RNA polymerase sigma factor [Hyphomicrobiaceae bacterium]